METVARTENPRRFMPFCQICGWRKGGPDSWNGVACKCGHQASPIDPLSAAERGLSMIIFD